MINTLCTVSLVNTSWRTQHCQGLYYFYILLLVTVTTAVYRRLVHPWGKNQPIWASHLASNNETTFKHIYIYIYYIIKLFSHIYIQIDVSFEHLADPKTIL